MIEVMAQRLWALNLLADVILVEPNSDGLSDIIRSTQVAALQFHEIGTVGTPLESGVASEVGNFVSGKVSADSRLIGKSVHQAMRVPRPLLVLVWMTLLARRRTNIVRRVDITAIAG